MPIKVLLADNSKFMRKAIRNLLNGDPEIELVGEADSLDQAIQIADELRPHIVIMDLHMGDGRQLTPSYVKSRLGGSRVLAISIWNDDGTKELAESLGTVTLLDKANLHTELIPAIRRHADTQEEINLRRWENAEAN